MKIEIDEELLAQARDAGLSTEALTERSLRREVASLERFHGLSDEEKAAKWAAENAEAIQAQRERIEQYGVFGEELRTW